MQVLIEFLVPRYNVSMDLLQLSSVSAILQNGFIKLSSGGSFSINFD